MIIMTKGFNEKAWRAENDAEIMAQYQEIMSNNSRKNAAIKAAKAKAKELTQRAEALRFATGGKLKKK